MTKRIKPTNYKDLVDIPNKLKTKLPTSFDVIGNILLLKLDDELRNFKNEIAKTLINTHKNVKTVCQIYPISGELRTRDIEIIGGEKSTETIHKEYGLTYHVDIEKTYFSSRLAKERERIKDLVKNNEVVVDMFTGVAPFAIMIAKYAKPKIIYAFDKNADAIKYAQKNIAINKVLDKIELINMDSIKAPEFLKKKSARADRIIMNLPFSALDFFTYSLEMLADEGVIHYYVIIDGNEINDRIAELEKIAEKKNYCFEKTNLNKIKSYSPHEFYIGIDITAKRK